MYNVFEQRRPQFRFPSQNTYRQSPDNLLMGILRNADAAKLTRDQTFLRLLMPAMIDQDSGLTGALRTYVNEHLIREMIDGFPFYQPSENVSLVQHGSRLLIMGRIIRNENRPYLYNIDSANQHILIIGGTGTGKTNLIYSIALQSMLHQIPVMIFDREKQDFRHLRRFKSAKDTIVAKAKDLPINFLQPPTGVVPQHWLVDFVTIFTKYNELLSGSESFLLAQTRHLYHDYGIFDGKTTYPTIHDLYQKIQSVPVKGNTRTSRFKETILNRLESYLALNGPASEFSKGVPAEWIAGKNIVIELSGLTERMSRFYVAMILQSLFKYRLASGMRGNTLRNLVIADECKYLTPPGYNPHLSFSPLTTLLSQAREAGIGMVLADQSAQLEPSVFVNTRCKICFRLGDGSDIRKIAQSMSLSRGQEQYITRLDTGECIVRIPNEDPFVMKTLPVNIE